MSKFQGVKVQAKGSAYWAGKLTAIKAVQAECAAKAAQGKFELAA